VTVYLSLGQALELHRVQIRRFGGSAGLRDRGALEAALARPQMTFGGEDLYPDVASKAAALMHSLVMNHPFVDGNKRVGAHASVLFPSRTTSSRRSRPASSSTSPSPSPAAR
jgi:death-on-curing protein